MARPKLSPKEKRIQIHASLKPEYIEVWTKVMKLYDCSPGRAGDIITRSAMNNPAFATLVDADK